MKHLKIKIDFISQSKQRYDTVGDYFFKKGILHFRITKTGNQVYDRILLMHEMIEQFLTQFKGVTDKEVDEFDFDFKGKGEPGDDPKCPYRNEHSIATAVERIICGHLGICWKTYDDYVGKL